MVAAVGALVEHPISQSTIDDLIIDCAMWSSIHRPINGCIGASIDARPD
jgi:hypothetical protein